LLAGLNWGFFLVTSNPGSGLDFSAFYAGVKVYQNYPHHLLYNPQLQVQALQAVPGAAMLFYNHPPYELLVWMPLARLSFVAALWTWRGVSLLLLGLASLFLAKAIGQDRGFWPTFLSSAAFFPVALCLAQGQDSILLLLVLSATLYFQHTRNDAVAGAVLALGLFKFQFVLPIAAVYFLWRRWRLLAGFGVGAIAVLLLNLPMVGYGGLRSLVLLVPGMERTQDLGVKVVQMANLRGLVHLCIGSDSLWAKAILVSVSVLLMVWAARSVNLETEQSFAIVVCFAVLVSYHANQHDLTILLIPMQLAIGNQMWKNPDGWKVIVPIILLFQPLLYLIVGGAASTGLLALVVVWLWYGLQVDFRQPVVQAV
jgi:hypothetical protein